VTVVDLLSTTLGYGGHGKVLSTVDRRPSPGLLIIPSVDHLLVCEQCDGQLGNGHAAARRVAPYVLAETYVLSKIGLKLKLYKKCKQVIVKLIIIVIVNETFNNG